MISDLMQVLYAFMALTLDYGLFFICGFISSSQQFNSADQLLPGTK